MEWGVVMEALLLMLAVFTQVPDPAFTSPPFRQHLISPTIELSPSFCSLICYLLIYLFNLPVHKYLSSSSNLPCKYCTSDGFRPRRWWWWWRTSRPSSSTVRYASEMCLSGSFVWSPAAKMWILYLRK